MIPSNNKKPREMRGFLLSGPLTVSPHRNAPSPLLPPLKGEGGYKDRIIRERKIPAPMAEILHS